jgi:hypothetical protein
MTGDMKPGTTLTILLIPSMTPAIPIKVVIMKVHVYTKPLPYSVPVNIVSLLH